MIYNKPDTKLDECIFVAEKIIPTDLCDAVVKDIETREWKPHEWYNTVRDTSHSEETMELDVQPTTPELQKLLGNFVVVAGKKYNELYSYQRNPSCIEKTGQIMYQFSPTRFNRYAPGPGASFLLSFGNELFGKENFGAFFSLILTTF